MRKSDWRLTGALGLAMVVATPVEAQEARAVVLQAQAGHYSALATLDRNGVWDTKSALGFGGSIGYRVTDVVAFKADGGYASSPVRFQGAESGDDLKRIHLMAVSEFKFFPEARLRPHLLAGGGALFLEQATAADPKQTLLAGVVGGGVSYRLGGSGVSLLAEARSYLYQGRGLSGGGAGDPRVQGDLLLSAGLSYALPLGGR